MPLPRAEIDIFLRENRLESPGRIKEADICA